MGRAWGEGEDPTTWAAPLARWLGVPMAMHVVAPVWAVGELIASLPLDRVGVWHAGLGVAAFLLVACLREWGRALVGRACGAEVGRVVVWPLGGLTNLGGPSRVRPLIAELGGVLAGVALMPVFAGALWLAGAPVGAWTSNPLTPSAGLRHLTSYTQVALWWLCYANVVVLAINLLVPAFPFDLARVVLARLSKRRTLPEAMAMACRVSAVAGLTLFVVGAAAEHTRVLALGVAAVLVTWIEFRRAAFVRSAPVRDADVAPAEVPSGEPEPVAMEEEDLTPTLDEVLRKISARGLESLTELERKVLRAETERRRAD